MLFLCLFLLAAPSFPATANSVARGAGAYAERAAAEKDSRSRYRTLEWTSLVLILAVGGAAIFWAVRRK